MSRLGKYFHGLETANLIRYTGRVSKLIGLTIESEGPAVEMGEVCLIYPLKEGQPIVSEVVGFKGSIVLLMPLGDMQGIGPGSRVLATGTSLQVDVGDALLGRVLDGLGNPMDGKGKPDLRKKYPVNNMPPDP